MIAQDELQTIGTKNFILRNAKCEIHKKSRMSCRVKKNFDIYD